MMYISPVDGLRPSPLFLFLPPFLSPKCKPRGCLSRHKRGEERGDEVRISINVFLGTRCEFQIQRFSAVY
jgi:hypothetical protein